MRAPAATGRDEHVQSHLLHSQNAALRLRLFVSGSVLFLGWVLTAIGAIPLAVVYALGFSKQAAAGAGAVFAQVSEVALFVAARAHG